MRLRLSVAFKNASRNYATRRPVKPPAKIVDPLLSSPNARVTNLPDGTTFIYRPPPTAPSPFSTTLLPASPLLRKDASTPESSSPTALREMPVPPQMRRERSFPSNRVLTEADFEKMRQLRESNPTYYTRGRLAKQFNCPPFLVAQKIPLDNQHRKVAIQKREAEHEEIRSKWGEQKSMVMATKKRRREYW